MIGLSKDKNRQGIPNETLCVKKNAIYSTVRFIASDRQTVQVRIRKTSSLFQQDRSMTCIQIDWYPDTSGACDL